MESTKIEPVVRRRSLFDIEIQSVGNHSKELITAPSLHYPAEYVENVKTEVKQWEYYFTEKLMEDHKEYRKNKKQLKTRVYDTSMLSTEHLDFLRSVNFDNYIIEGNKFLTKACIAFEKHRVNVFDNVILEKIDTVKQQIAEEVFKSHD